MRVDDFQQTWTWFTDPEIALRRRIDETLPLLVVCMDFGDDSAVNTQDQIDRMVFGPAPSVVDYFQWASRGQFRFTRAGRGVYGWYRAPITQAQYTDEMGLARARGISPNSGYMSSNVRRTDTILAAMNDLARDLDFAQIDRNGDGIITPDELAVFLVWGGRSFSDASVRWTYPKQLDLGNGYILHLHVPAAYEKRFSRTPVVHGPSPLSPATFVHEIGHSVFGLTDLYPDGNPTTEAPGPFSVMDSDTALDAVLGVPSLDAWALVQLGWAEPRLVTGGPTRSTQQVQMDAVELSHEVLILPIYGRDTREYFLIENRFGEGTYNGGFFGSPSCVDVGLAIWHFDQDRRRNGSFEMRDALRLVRAQGPVPAISGNVDQTTALFDGSASSTSYYWWDRSSPRNSRTRTGEATGICVWPIPDASPTVLFRAGNPYDELERSIPPLEAELQELERELREDIPNGISLARVEFVRGEISVQSYLLQLSQIRARKFELRRNLIPGKQAEIVRVRNQIIESTKPIFPDPAHEIPRRHE